MLKKIQISNKLKEFLWGLTMVILVSLFTYTVVKIFTEKSDTKYQASLERIDAEAAHREQLADAKRDSARQRDEVSFEKIIELRERLQQQQNFLNKFQNSFDRNLEQLKQVQNEKDYIPDNTTPSQQSTYLSDYKYEPY